MIFKRETLEQLAKRLQAQASARRIVDLHEAEQHLIDAEVALGRAKATRDMFADRVESLKPRKEP